MVLDVGFLTHSPVDQPLPEGLQADPTYLAFLRGAGMDQTTAWTTALQHLAAVKANYATQVQRDPEQLRQANEGTDQAYLNNGGWANGNRLQELARNRVTDQQRLQDLATGEATGISDTHTQLQQQLSQLGRNNVDQIGALQGRQDQQNNQDKYIAAVGAANQQPVGAAIHPAVAAGADLAQMTPGQQGAFRTYVTSLAQQRAAKNAAAQAAGTGL